MTTPLFFPRYEIRFMRDCYPYDYVVIADNIKTLNEARDLRKMSGDLV